jgi:glyoxylase-like metal-dependent hydrolase (beta-lactamase superfamily II)/rhodanese-related sulfurtransferase
MDLDLIVTEGLGDSTYVLSVDGDAAVIDPQRDVERAIATAASRNAAIRYVFETHVHNDYVSGANALREGLDIEVVAPADGGYAFPVRGVRDGDEVKLGGLRLVAMATPGHTPEHTSYLLLADGDDEPIAVFSGGSLIVGGAGRTDLLGADRVGELVGAQFATMRRFADLPDRVRVLPTHGAGSFCAAPATTPHRISTIGAERVSNDALRTEDLATFAREQLDGLPAYPTYYARMAALNRAGPNAAGDPDAVPRLDADAVADAIGRGVVIVDARDGAAFAEAHVPGSLDVPLEDGFGTYVGWLVPFGTPLVLVVEDDRAAREAVLQLARIGYDRVEGVLDGGIEAWRASGRPVAAFPTIDAAALAGEISDGTAGELLDVRQRAEWDDGHLEGSRHVFVGDLPSELGAFSREEVTTVICASGFRSAMAASLLDRAGVPVRLVARSGVPRVAKLLASR